MLVIVCAAKVDRKRLMKTLMVVVCNELLFIPFLWAMYYVMKWRGCTFKDELPTFQWFLIEFVVYLLIEEVGFYYSHRYTALLYAWHLAQLVGQTVFVLDCGQLTI